MAVMDSFEEVQQKLTEAMSNPISNLEARKLVTMNGDDGAEEIINAAKVISTPIISCRLVTSDSEASARIVKGRLEKTHLGDVSRSRYVSNQCDGPIQSGCINP